MTRAVRTLTFLCILLAASACEERTTVPTPVTQLPLTSLASTQVFSGTLSPAGSQTFAFTIGAAAVRVSLGSLTDDNGAPLPQSLRLTFGVPQGTGCGAIQAATTSTSLSTQLQLQVAGGTYCMSVEDVGQLTTTATFGVRVTLGDPSTRGGGGTITYAQTVLPKGSTSRSFDASLRGDVTIFFDTIDPASVASLGLGIGFPRADGGGCVLNQTFTATRGSQFTFPVEAGTYCVQVSDPGTLTGPAQFSLRIQHP
jgi:hypothetical protein